MADAAKQAELVDLKQNVRNLGECLQAVLKRIEELETDKPTSITTTEVVELKSPTESKKSKSPEKQGKKKKNGKHNTNTSNSNTVTTVVNGDGHDGDANKQVKVEESESVDADGTLTKRVHITERVVTTKTFQTVPSPDCEFKAPPYNDKQSMLLNNTQQSVRLTPCVVGYRRKKNDEHLVSTAYAARLCRVTTLRCSDGTQPDSSSFLALQGLTVQPENGQLRVQSITKDSPLAKQGIIREGDLLLELNGKEMKSQADLEAAWKAGGDTIALKLIPGEPEQPSPDAKYVKAMYDYTPSADSDHPCADVGLSFKVGDVLHVVNTDDNMYWQARKVNDLSRIGFIPSRKLAEDRQGGGADKSLTSKFGSLFSKRKRHDEAVGKDLDTPYEEVSKLSPYGRRVLVLLGAPGVGRRTLKSMLLAHNAQDFATVTPYTSRDKRDGEQEGREYNFVKRENIQKEVDRGGFVEWGEFNNNLYGTSVQSVRDIIGSGRVCVLDCSPQAARYLYTKEFMPYVVFISPPSLEELKQLYQLHPNRTKQKSTSDLNRTCDESAKLETQYKNLIDTVLVNRNVDVTFRRLVDALESLKTDTQWVPSSWIH